MSPKKGTASQKDISSSKPLFFRRDVRFSGFGIFIKDHQNSDSIHQNHHFNNYVTIAFNRSRIESPGPWCGCVSSRSFSDCHDSAKAENPIAIFGVESQGRGYDMGKSCSKNGNYAYDIQICIWKTGWCTESCTKLGWWQRDNGIGDISEPHRTTG